MRCALSITFATAVLAVVSAVLAPAHLAIAQPSLNPLENTLPPPPGAKAVSPTPRTDREPGYLGIVVNDEGEGGRGVRVTAVREGSPGETGGLRTRDLVVAVNGRPMTGLPDLADVLDKVAAGDKLQFDVVRDGERRQIEVTLGRRPPSSDRSGEPGRLDPRFDSIPPLPRASGAPAGKPVLGVRVLPLTDDTRARFRTVLRRGAVIESIQAGSPAEVYGLPVGGVIVSVDGLRIDGPEDLVAVIADSRVGEEVEVGYYDREQHFRKTVRLAPAGEASGAPRGDEPPLILPPRSRDPSDGRPSLPGPIDRLLDRVLPPEVPRPIIGGGSSEVGELRRQVAELQRRLDELSAENEELKRKVDALNAALKDAPKE